MKFNITTAFVALTFLPAIIAAPLTRRSGIAFKNGDYQGITVGTPLTICWSGNEGAVTITLKSGSADTLETVGTIAAGIWGTSTSYTPTTAGTYVFEISDASGNANYSPQFYMSPALAHRSTTKDAALYLPLLARSLTPLSPRGSKTKTQGKHELLAMGSDETTPCWAYENVGGIPDICLSPSGKTYIYAKEQAKEPAALWAARYNNLQHGPIKGTKEYAMEEKEREKKGIEKRRNMNPTLPANRKMREDLKDASEWSERFHNLMYGPFKGSEEYKKEEEGGEGGGEG